MLMTVFLWLTLGFVVGGPIALGVSWDDLLGIGECVSKCVSNGLRRFTDVLEAIVALLCCAFNASRLRLLTRMGTMLIIAAGVSMPYYSRCFQYG